MLFPSEVDDSLSLLERGAYFEKKNFRELFLCVCYPEMKDLPEPSNIYLKEVYSVCSSLFLTRAIGWKDEANKRLYITLENYR